MTLRIGPLIRQSFPVVSLLLCFGPSFLGAVISVIKVCTIEGKDSLEVCAIQSIIFQAMFPVSYPDQRTPTPINTALFCD